MRQQQPPCVVHSLSGADVSSGSEAEGEEELAGHFEIKMNLQKGWTAAAHAFVTHSAFAWPRQQRQHFRGTAAAERTVDEAAG